MNKREVKFTDIEVEIHDGKPYKLIERIECIPCNGHGQSYDENGLFYSPVVYCPKCNGKGYLNRI